MRFNVFDGVADGLADRGLVPADLRPTLAHAFPILGAPGSSSSWDAFVAALRAVFARLGPCVLLLDDVHWADADSQRLLAALLAAPNRPPILFVLAGRPAEWLAKARFGREARRITLGPLAADDVAALVNAHAPERSALDVARLVDETEGHPLLLSELLLEERDRTADEGAQTLEDVFGRRVSTVGADARHILELLASAVEAPDGKAIAELAERDPNRGWRPLLRGGRSASSRSLRSSSRRSRLRRPRRPFLSQLPACNRSP